MGYISSEYFYAMKSSKDIALIIIGYLDKTQNKLIIKGIENYFPKNSRSSYSFEHSTDENIFKTLLIDIIGTNTWKDKCMITSKMNWGGDYVPYTGDNLTSKEKKDGLKRAINVLKMFNQTNLI